MPRRRVLVEAAFVTLARRVGFRSDLLAAITASGAAVYRQDEDSDQDDAGRFRYRHDFRADEDTDLPALFTAIQDALAARQALAGSRVSLHRCPHDDLGPTRPNWNCRDDARAFYREHLVS